MNKKIPIIITISIVFLALFFILTKQTNTDTVSKRNQMNQSGTQPSQVVQVNQATGASIFTLAEVAKHNTKTDCWIVIDSSVINATDYIASGKHNPEIVRGCGLDATAMFEAERKHTKGEAQSLLKELAIGTLSQ